MQYFSIYYIHPLETVTTTSTTEARIFYHMTTMMIYAWVHTNPEFHECGGTVDHTCGSEQH